MQIQTTLEMTITLQLSKREALYIKQIMQNSPDGDLEQQEQREIRSEIFHALPSFEQLI